MEFVLKRNLVQIRRKLKSVNVSLDTFSWMTTSVSSTAKLPVGREVIVRISQKMLMLALSWLDTQGGRFKRFAEKDWQDVNKTEKPIKSFVQTVRVVMSLMRRLEHVKCLIPVTTKMLVLETERCVFVNQSLDSSSDEFTFPFAPHHKCECDYGFTIESKGVGFECVEQCSAREHRERCEVKSQHCRRKLSKRQPECVCPIPGYVAKKDPHDNKFKCTGT